MFNQTYLGIEIIFSTSYEDAKKHAIALDEVARHADNAKYPNANVDPWFPVKNIYQTAGLLMTQIKREIKRNLAGYRKGQVFFVYQGILGLGTDESPYKRYFHCLANANHNGTEAL